MTDLTRRQWLFLGRRREEAETEPPPAMPRPNADGLAWQRAQGTPPPAHGGLPGPIAWLQDYIDGAPMSDPDTLSLNVGPLLRPPGAIGEKGFLSACTRCGDCQSACPHGSITPAPAQFKDAAGTPMLDPAVAPCWLCEDMPCTSACETGALRADGAAMGSARIQHLDCLDALGTPCSACAEQCPTGAITRSGRGPHIEPGLCAGCGVCHYVCPAPVNAVAILPNPDRPAEGLSR